MNVETDKRRGVYLHFHGGGWAEGAPETRESHAGLQDPRLERVARECEVAVIVRFAECGLTAGWPAIIHTKDGGRDCGGVAGPPSVQETG